jgi:hypothetical protein
MIFLYIYSINSNRIFNYLFDNLNLIFYYFFVHLNLETFFYFYIFFIKIKLIFKKLINKDK